MVNWTLTAVALVTGVAMGGLFKFLRVPMPAPPELPGLMGIVGVYLGYKLMGATGVGYDLMELLGAA
jgi:XapX domain-containing protein